MTLPFILALALAAQPGGALRLTFQAEPKTLDPLHASEEPAEIIRYLTSGTLVRLNLVSQALEPGLALTWKLVPGGRSISFQLRTGVAFSDGTPFAPADVCHTFAKALDPASESTVYDTFQIPASQLICAAAPPASVQLTFPKPVAGLDRLMAAVPILSARSPHPESAVLGPFVVASRKPGVSITLARNPRSWMRDASGARLPYLDSIVFEIQRNRDFELRRFMDGELDLAGNLSAELYERLKARAPAAVRDLGVSLDTEQLWFNQAPASALPAHKRAWFASRQFRLAVSLAISRADLARVVYLGHAAPAAGPVSPANRFWFNQSLSSPAADPARALQLLNQAGFRLRDGRLFDATGQPVQFSIITNSGNRNRERMATMIQSDLAPLGIAVTVTPLDFPSLIDRIMKSFDYDACLLGLVGAGLDPNGQMNVWMSSAAQHAWNPNQKSPATAWEAEIDRLMLAQASEPDPRKRKAAFDRVQQIVSDQAPVLYLVYPNSLVAAGARIRGFNPSVLRPQTLWNAERLSLAGAPRP